MSIHCVFVYAQPSLCLCQTACGRGAQTLCGSAAVFTRRICIERAHFTRSDWFYYIQTSAAQSCRYLRLRTFFKAFQVCVLCGTGNTASGAELHWFCFGEALYVFIDLCVKSIKHLVFSCRRLCCALRVFLRNWIRPAAVPSVFHIFLKV